MAGHVFISYSSEDRPYVELLAAELTRLAIPVWYDRHIRTGARFIPEIEKQI